MQLKNISETLLPELLKRNFGREIFNKLENSQSISVKGFAGSAPSVFVAELFLLQKKSVLFLLNDKEEGLYVTSELEELLGKENVLYFPPSHLEPYQIEKVQNANLVLRTEVLNRLNSETLSLIHISEPTRPY